MNKTLPSRAPTTPYCVENIITAKDAGPTFELDLASAEYRQGLFVVRGFGTITLDGVTWKLEPGAFIIAPTRCLCVLRLRRGAHVFRIAASEGFLRTKVAPALYMPDSEYWTNYRNPNVIGVWTGPGHAKARERILDELESAREKLGMDCDGSVISYMFVILLAASRQSHHRTRTVPHTDRTPSMNLAMSFRELVEQKFRNQLRLADYCRLLGITPARLARACKSLLACTPSAVIHERVLVEAKGELAYSVRTVSEIAYGLGFDDAAYFCRFFKQHTGHSPMEFRNISSHAGDAGGAAARAAVADARAH
jgi:AraC family transcriptional activator of pobA